MGTDDAARVIAVRSVEGRNPGLVWLGGYHSDMNGTKAEAMVRLGNWKWPFSNAV